MQTTIGQVLVNDALPREFRDYSRILTSDKADDLLGAVASKHPELYRAISHALVQLGRNAAFDESATLSLDDMRVPLERKELFDHAQAQTRKIMASKDMTDDEKQKALSGVYGQRQKFFGNKTYKSMLALDNPFALQVVSRARGNPAQLAGLMTTPGTYTDAYGKLIPVFVRHSYAEGLSPHEYWAGTYGARTGVISTKFCLAADTQVLINSDLSQRSIAELRPGDSIWTVDDAHRLIPTRVTAVTCVGERSCNAYAFGIGGSSAVRTIVGTPEHKLLVQYRQRKSNTVIERMLTLHKASHGRCAVVLPAGTASDDRPKETRALLLGALLGDGGLTTHNTMVHVSDKALHSALEKCAVEHGMQLTKVTEHEHVTSYRIQELKRSSGIGNGKKSPFRMWLHTIGVLGKYAYNKTIPACVFGWSNESVYALVAGLWATNGCTTAVTNKYNVTYPIVTFYVPSRELAESLRRLLYLRMGVYASPVAIRPVAGELSVFPDGRTSTRNYDLYGFVVVDITSLQRLADLCPHVADKIDRLSGMLNTRDCKRAPNFNSLYRYTTPVGVRTVYDIEVEHPSHRFVLADGFIVSNSTRDAGDLGKQFNQASMRMVVTEPDCETVNGIPVDIDDKDTIGSVLARQSGKYPAGTVVDKAVLSDLDNNEHLSKIVVRSPLTCSLPQGVCQQCTGLREDGKLPQIGAHVGINASSALAERIAQGSLNTKHSGGMTKEDGGKVYAGFDVINQLFQVPKTFPDSAAIATLDGRVERIEPAAQGGQHIWIDGAEHYVLPGHEVSVKEGDRVEAGDQLSSGILNPRDVVQYKGIGEGRRYLTERVAQAFKDSGYAANRRNIEILVRGMMDHAVVNDPAGAGDYLPGDVASYNALANAYRPRQDARQLDADNAVGQYLEQPVLHHTIGTRITRGIAKQLKDFGHNSVLAHKIGPSFEPYMVGLRAVPQHEQDWMAQLGSSHLEKNLLKNVHRNADSHAHGLHPVPSMARGLDFGQTKEVGY
jgi:hypothetical protein